MADLKTILDEAIAAGKAAKAGEQNETAALRAFAAADAVAKKYGYDSYDELRPSVQYYRQYGEVPTGGAAAFGRELAAGFAFEGADEAEALVRSVFSDDSYDDLVTKIRADRDAYFQRATAAALTANVAGGFAMPVGALGASARLANIAARAPMRTAVLGGAAQGAATGLGAGEGLGDRLQGAAIGTAIAAPVSAAGYGAARGLQRAFRNPAQRADMRVGDAMIDDGVDAASMRAAVLQNQAADTAAGDVGQEMLVDYGNDALRRLLRGARTVSSGASGRIDDALTVRQQGTSAVTPSALSPDQQVIGQAGRIQKSLESARPQSADANAAAVVDNLVELQGADPVVGNLYKAAYAANENVVDDVVIRTVAQNRKYASAYRQARERAINEALARGEDATKIMSRLPENPAMLIDEAGEVFGGLPLKVLDDIKRLEGRRLYRSKRQGFDVASDKKNLGAFTDRLKNEATVGDDYSDVLKITADEFAVEAAEQVGRKAVKGGGMRADELRAALNGMTQAEKDALRLGALDEMVARLDTLDRGRNAVKAVTKSQKDDAVIEILFEDDPEALTRFVRRLEREREMSLTKGRVMGGSNTLDKLTDAGEVAPSRLTRLSDMAGTGMRLAERALTQQRGRNTADAITDVLTEQNPAAQLSALDRIARLNETLMRNRQMAAGTGLGLTGGLRGLAGGLLRE